MKKNLIRLPMLVLVLAGVLALTGRTAEPVRELLTMRRATIDEVKQKIERQDPTVMPAYKKLLRDADKALKEGPWSVMMKTQTPPSGDKHDYVSMGPYWWPDPAKPDGLPYIRRDGQTNPEYHEYSDAKYLGKIVNAVSTLGLAYYYSGDRKYADHAAKLLKVWFLDPETRMNPHLKYGQRIPGITEGRYIGIIDTRNLPRMLNSVILLEGSEAWSAADDRALQAWFSAYNDWLINDPMGHQERRQPNNHGTYYDVQVAGFALYCGKPEIARHQIETYSFPRLDAQLSADGEQPHEMARTRPWGYCTMNILGFTEIAYLADAAGLDFWNHATSKGASLRTGIEWFFPYIAQEKPFPKPEITGKYGAGNIVTVIAMARRYNPAEYDRQIRNVPRFTTDEYNIKTSVVNLTYPFVE